MLGQFKPVFFVHPTLENLRNFKKINQKGSDWRLYCVDDKKNSNFVWKNEKNFLSLKIDSQSIGKSEENSWIKKLKNDYFYHQRLIFFSVTDTSLSLRYIN